MRIKIKLASIYKIEHISGYYYIGMSIDTFSRFSSHYTDIKMLNHSSISFQNLFNSTRIEDWTFSILEYISLTDHRLQTKLKGKPLQDSFRKLLLKKEKEWMKKHSINFCLNKNNKSFS